MGEPDALAAAYRELTDDQLAKLHALLVRNADRLDGKKIDMFALVEAVKAAPPGSPGTWQKPRRGDR